MKSERVTLLTTPAFKAFLTKEALRQGVSVAELVRRRCEPSQTDEEALLASLTAELHKAVGVAKRSLNEGLDEARAVLKELRSARGVEHRQPAKSVVPASAGRRRKLAGARA
jgi:hypothetical protein